MSISTRLISAFMGVTLVVLLATLLLARWSFERGFLDYVNALEQTRLERLALVLSDEYREAGMSWEELDDFKLGRLIRRSMTGQPMTPPDLALERPSRPPGPPERPRFPSTQLLDAQGQAVAGRLMKSEDPPIRVPVMLDGQRVGLLLSAPVRHVNSPLETAFARQQFQTSLMIALVCLLLAGLVSWLLTRRLMVPLKRMTAGISSMSLGDYQVQLPGSGRDELGQLIADLNHLAVTLDEAQNARQRWFASISHELRTPTTVLTGELEAMKDGIRPLDMAQVDSIAQEVARLRHLIDDLYQLSLSDIGGLRYSMQRLDLSQVLEQSLAAIVEQAQRQGIQVTQHGQQAAWIQGDPQRLHQLFDNLLANALAYTDGPGKLQIRQEIRGDKVYLSLEDSPPGITTDECDKLFEPLYRHEQSRSRRSAGAGLGLAICRNIVQAHRGELNASPSSLGGLRIELELPLAGEAQDDQ